MVNYRPDDDHVKMKQKLVKIPPAIDRQLPIFTHHYSLLSPSQRQTMLSEHHNDNRRQFSLSDTLINERAALRNHLAISSISQITVTMKPKLLLLQADATTEENIDGELKVKRY